MDGNDNDTLEIASDGATGQLRSDDALPPFVAHQVAQESLENAPSSPNAAGEQFRRGRVEAETRRVSEEVTREAQRRRKAEAAAQAQADAEVARAAAPTFPAETNLPAPRSLRRFFVPLDGTLLGERALPYATTFSRLLGAHVLLGHVTPTDPPAMLGQVFGTSAARRQAELQDFAPEALPYLRLRQAWMAPGRREAVDTLHVTAPSVIEGLLQIEKSRDIDLVTVALDVEGNPGDARVGKVVDSLIRRGVAPALVIPPGADAGARPCALRHVVAPLDGSPLAEESLGPLMGLLGQLREQNGELPDVTLLAVAEDYSIQPDYQAYLETLRDTLMKLPVFAGVRVRAVTEVGSAPGAIVAVANHGISGEGEDDGHDVSVPADLLLMTTHGRSGLGRWLFGSVAHYVLPRVQVPVLLTRPGSPVVEQ